MNKKSNKKKKKRNGGKGKENAEVEKREEIEDVCGWKKNEEKETLSYEIRTSDVMGRYIVARKDIAPGEVIIQAPALVIGPCTGCSVLCLGCYRELDESAIYKCPDCKWPLCGAACGGRNKEHGHSVQECAALKKVPPNYHDSEDLKESYQAITPLRCLLTKKLHADRWTAICAMEPHNEMRRRRADIWRNNDVNVVQRLAEWGFSEFTPEEIHTVCGILEVNAFEVGVSGSSARGLYERAHLLAHDCTPTTTHTDSEGLPGRPLTIRAAVPHRPGDLISLCYAYTLQGTLKRREHIMHSKFFDCCCKRCADPTELGTYVSAFRCPKCASGRVLPTRPLDNDAPWACTAEQCGGYVMPAAGVHMLLKRLTDEYDQIDVNDVKGYEGFLHKYRNVVQPTHYLCLCCKHSLSQLYGKTTDYMIQEMPAAELNRKIDICREIMKAFDIIEPGYSRLRGITLYELHAPLMILTTREFEKRTISKEDLRTRLQEIVGYLKEAATILSLEPPQSSEGLMAGAARDALTRIKTWEKIIGKIC